MVLFSGVFLCLKKNRKCFHILKAFKILTMKKLVLMFFLLPVVEVFAQQRHIELHRKKLLTEVPAVVADTADKALRIASYLFNSREFQDSISRLTFKYSNYCKNCSRGVQNRRERIASAVILDSLF